MDPQQRDGIDYEFTVVWNINQAHMAESQKDRTHLFDGKPEIISPETGKRLMEWLNSGAAPAAPAVAKPTLGEAYKAAAAAGHTKEALLQAASAIAGYPIKSAADVKPESVEPVILAWSAL